MADQEDTQQVIDWGVLDTSKEAPHPVEEPPVEQGVTPKPTTSRYAKILQDMDQTVHLREKTRGEDVLEFGLDTADVLAGGVASIVHGSTNLLEEGINTLAGGGIADPIANAIIRTFDADYVAEPVEPVLDVIDDDLNNYYKALGIQRQSLVKETLSHAIGTVATSTSISNSVMKWGALVKRVETASLTSRLAFKAGVAVTAEVGAGAIAPNKYRTNLFDVISPEVTDTFNFLATSDLDPDDATIALRNLGADIFTGVVGGALLDSVVSLYKLIGTSTKVKSYRAHLYADLVDDSNLALFKNFTKDAVDGTSLMLDKALNKPRVPFTVDPLRDDSFTAMGETFESITRNEAKATGNLNLKADAKIKQVNQEVANKAKSIEFEKAEELKQVDVLEAELKAELKLEQEALLANPLTSTKQMVKHEVKAGKKLEALEARRVKITEQASKDHEIVGTTAKAREEAIQLKLDVDVKKVQVRTLGANKELAEDLVEIEKLKKIDAENKTIQSTDDELDTLVNSTSREGVDAPMDGATKAEKVERIVKKQEQKRTLEQGVEQRVSDLRKALDDEATELTEAEIKITNNFIERYDEGMVVRNQEGKAVDTLLTKQEALDEVTNILGFFGKEVDQTKKVINSTDNLSYINKVINEGVTDELTGALDLLAKTSGLDRESLLMNMQAWGVVIEEATPVVTAIRMHLDQAIDEFHGEMKRLVPKIDPKAPLLAEDIEVLARLSNVVQSLHAGLGGIKSPLGRGLRAGGSGYGSTNLNSALDGVRRDLNMKVPTKQALKNNKTKKTILDEFMRELSVKDQKQLKRMINDMAKMERSELTGAILSKTMDQDWFNQLGMSHGILGLISAPKTLAKVAWGTFLHLGWDQLVVKNFESSIALVGRNLGITENGQRFDNFARLKAHVAVLHDYLKYWKGDKNALGSIGSVATDYSDRTITMGFKAIHENIGNAVGLRKTKDFLDNESIPYLSSTVTKVEDLIHKSHLFTLSSYALGKPIRGMEMVDSMVRRMTIESELASNAYSTFANKGGKAFFGDSISEKQFVDRFMSKSRKYMKLKDSLHDKKLSALEFQDEVTALFKNDKRMLDSVEESSTWSAERAVRNTQQEDTSDHTLGQVLKAVNTKATGNTPEAMMLRLVSNILVPFQKSPINSLRTAQESTPFALTSARTLETFRTGTTTEKINALAKVASGSALMTSMYMYVAEGSMTGSTPRGEYRKNENRRWRERSFLIGDTYVSYDGYGPVSTLLAVVADAISHGAKEGEEANTASMLFALGISVASVDSQANGLHDVFEAVTSKDPARFQKLLAQKLVPFVEPLRGVSTGLNDLVHGDRFESAIAKEQEGLLGQIELSLTTASRNSAFGLLAKTNENIYVKKLDAMGQPISKYSGTWAGRIMGFAGIKTTTLDPDPFRAQLVELGLMSDSTMPKSIEGMQLDSVADRNLTDNIWNGNGKRDGLNTKLKRYMSTKDFRSKDKVQRKALAKSMIDDETEYYKGIYLQSNEELRQRVRTKEEDEWLDDTSTHDLTTLKPEDRMKFATGSNELRKKLLKEQGNKLAEGLNIE